MARDIIDDRLVGALHLRALDRAGLAQDPALQHVAYQAGTLSALMDGAFDGDLALADLLRHGDLGIGTVAGLAGELVVIDGEAFVVEGDGTVSRPRPEVTTPFAVVCGFAPQHRFAVTAPTTLGELRARIDAVEGDPAVIVAVRIDGRFRRLAMRSVHRQHPPYPTLAEVTAHQTEWQLDSLSGSVVGFRFPDGVAAIDVPGHHLHVISDDRTAGGHLLDLEIASAEVRLDVSSDLHLELPAGVALGEPGRADRETIARIEGQRPG